jgi:hypothetical protein
MEGQWLKGLGMLHKRSIFAQSSGMSRGQFSLDEVGSSSDGDIRDKAARSTW